MSNAFCAGALSGGLANMIGGIGDKIGLGNDLAFKTIAHGASGGVQSMAGGGNFWSGFAGGAAANVTGFAVDGMDNDLMKIGAAGLAGGVSSWAAGGDFGQGVITGAGVEAFNHLGDHLFGGGPSLEQKMEQNVRKSMKDYRKRTDPKLDAFIKKHDLPWKTGVKATSIVLKKVTNLNVPIKTAEYLFLHPTPLY